MGVATQTVLARLRGVLHQGPFVRYMAGEAVSMTGTWMHVMAQSWVMASTTVFVFPVMVVMLPLYARNLLQLGPDKMGLLMGISSIGSLTGSVSLLAVSRNRRPALLFAAVLAATLVLFSLSQVRQFWLAAASLVMLSLWVSSLIGLANTIVQERAPSPLRGRVSAIAGLSFFGLMPFASLGITSLADGIGMRAALFLSAVFYLGAAVLVLTAVIVQD